MLVNGIIAFAAERKENYDALKQECIELLANIDTLTARSCAPIPSACSEAYAKIPLVLSPLKYEQQQERILTAWAACDFKLGDYARSESRHRELLSLRIRLQGANHEDVANGHSNLASVLKEIGKYDEAETEHRRALDINHSLYGDMHPSVATTLCELASVLTRKGRFGDAETMHRQALSIRRKLFGEHHRDVTNSLNGLAIVIDRQGRYSEAEAIYRDAIRTQRLLHIEEEDSISISTLGNLAVVLSKQMNHIEAEAIFRRVLALDKKHVGEEHPDVIMTMINLAGSLFYQGKYLESELLHRSALAMTQKILGPEHPFVAFCYNSIANDLVYQGKYMEAEIWGRRALELSNKIYGEEHVETVTSLNSVAGTLLKQGKIRDSETIFLRSLTLRRKLLAPEHPSVADTLGNLVSVSLAEGKLERAISYLWQVITIRENQLSTAVSASRIQSYLTAWRPEEDTTYGLLLDISPHESSQLAMTLALLRKGRLMDAGASVNRVLHRSKGVTSIAKQFADWQSAQAEYERQLLMGRRNGSQSDYQSQLQKLKLQSVSHEHLLASMLPSLRNFQVPNPVQIISDVAQHIPSNAVLVEVVSAKPTPGFAASIGNKRVAHYIAMVMKANQQITALDLGEKTSIDTAVQELRSSLSIPTSSPISAARTLFDIVVRPIVAVTGVSARLYLSLDDALQLIPFDALHDGKDYLLGRYKFHYLTSGRDLLRKPSNQPVGPALVLGNPYFGKSADAESETGSSVYKRLTTLSDLPWAQQEAESVAKLLGVRAVTGASAKEELLRDRLAPSVVHLATHGLLLADVTAPMSPGTRSALLLASPPEEKMPASTEPPVSLPGLFGPMNRAALVFANARQGAAAEDKSKDGLLTAEEARSLDLDGTQLVVLSACETGQGETSSGQGVYGLRRAFLIAGAETVVTSLWRVHDEATGELMTKYYGKLLDKEHPGDRLGAMIESMQELRARPGREHPYYWAPFLVIGADGPLRVPTNVSQTRP